jgi:hypothetical protein
LEGSSEPITGTAGGFTLTTGTGDVAEMRMLGSSTAWADDVAARRPDDSIRHAARAISPAPGRRREDVPLLASI